MSRRDRSGARGLRGLGAGEGHGLAAGQGGPVPGADGDLVGGVVPVEAEVVRGPGALASPGHHGSSHLALQSTLGQKYIIEFVKKYYKNCQKYLNFMFQSECERVKQRNMLSTLSDFLDWEVRRTIMKNECRL